MNLPRPRVSLMRAAGAAVLTAAALAGGLPGVASASPAYPGDRTVTATVKNHSNVRLSLSDSEVTDGEWMIDPPNAIKGFKTAKFGSTSSEDEGGTEATATYQTKYGAVEFYWSDPWVIDNQFTCDVPPELTCQVDGDLGATTKVTYDIYSS
jgi:hypothetical protein